jgi:ComF family protein
MLSFLLSSVIVPIRDFLYPPLCFVCDTPLTGEEDRVCLRCWGSFKRIGALHPVWQGAATALRSAGEVSDLVSCYLFEKEGALQTVVHLLKYSGMKVLGTRLGREVGVAVREHPSMSKADVIIPVPLHPLKQRERGYNQSDYLCRGISESSGIPAAGTILRRTRYTSSQTHLTHRERVENVKGAFELRRGATMGIRGKKCILVDDVITTGATLNACAQLLHAAGAERVFAASAAVAE